MVAEPQGALTYHSSTLTVLADSVLFHGLLLIVLGYGGISTVTEPRGALTCTSLTLAILADCSLFRGLLLTILGSRSDFYGC